MEGDDGNDENAPPSEALSKSARKKLLKRQRLEERKANRRAAEKERRRRDLERRRAEWDERLAAAPEEERERLVDERRAVRRERVERRAEERGARAERLRRAAEGGQKLVIDLDFAHLMTSNEIHSLAHQIMYCYAVNGKCASPAHLWLTGCTGEIETQLRRLPGYDRWIIEKESRPYIEAFQDHKEDLVYLTADAETILDELDPKKIYIVGGLVDRNRWKGVTMKKADDQGIKSAKLPIMNYIKMSSSPILTVNQVVEILLKYLETQDWKDAFFQVIPQRKRGEADAEVEESENKEADFSAVDIVTEEGDEVAEGNVECGQRKKRCIEELETEEAEDATEMFGDGVGGMEEEGDMHEKQHIRAATNCESEELQ